VTEEYWDRVGHGCLALFTVYGLTDDPDFLVCVLGFGFLGFLIWVLLKNPQ
jgi:hypothetical protein